MTTLDDFAEQHSLDGRTRVALAAFVREVRAEALEEAAQRLDNEATENEGDPTVVELMDTAAHIVRRLRETR